MPYEIGKSCEALAGIWRFRQGLLPVFTPSNHSPTPTGPALRPGAHHGVVVAVRVGVVVLLVPLVVLLLLLLQGRGLRLRDVLQRQERLSAHASGAHGATVPRAGPHCRVTAGREPTPHRKTRHVTDGGIVLKTTQAQADPKKLTFSLHQI